MVYRQDATRQPSAEGVNEFAKLSKAIELGRHNTRNKLAVNRLGFMCF